MKPGPDEDKSNATTSTADGSLAAAPSAGPQAGLAAANDAGPAPPPPHGNDDPTRTRTRDAADTPSPGSPPIERLPAPLQYRDRQRYQIVAEHGRGGLGCVYRARDRELGRDVALKELLHRGASGELRFFREALITARLEHPGIVPVHEAGRWPDGTPFYAMKLVAGRPLKVLIEACKNLDDRLALLPNVTAVADALAYAHDRRIIHRDLKPSNVIVGDFGETVVIDWGLAKVLDADGDDEVSADERDCASLGGDGVTIAGAVLGTPAYMAPEQARGEPADERADVFAIGGILYQLCTGAPVPGSSSPVSIHRDLSHVDRDLATIVAKSLAAEPGRRYPNAGALASDLRAFDSGARIASRRYSLAGLLRHWISRNRRASLAIAVTAVVAAVATTLSLSEIVAQRDRTSTALARAQEARIAADSARVTAEHERIAAEQQRDRARLSLAALLVEKDPTAAHGLLTTADRHSAEESLLRTRALSAGVAARRIGFGLSRIEDAALSSDRRRLAIITGDLGLHELDLETGIARVLATDLAEPGFVMEGDGGWLVATPTKQGVALHYPDGGGRAVIPLPDEPVPPGQGINRPDGLYLLMYSGRLLHVAPGSTKPRLVRHDVQAITAVGANDVLGCTTAGLLVRVTSGHTSTVGRCRYDVGTSTLASAADAFVVSESKKTLRLTRQEKTLRFSIALGKNSHVTIADSGLMSVIDRDGKSWYRPPGSVALQQHPSGAASATMSATSGQLAVWGYSDGSVRAVDAQSGEAWTFAHAATIAMIYVDERQRLVVSVGGSEVRLWHLPHRRQRLIAQLGCQVLNIVADPDTGRVASDCTDGTVWMLRGRAGSKPTLLHRHGALAFGVTWWGSQVCSGSWDGTVVCTNPDTHETKVLGKHAARIRWIAATHEYLTYALADGSVWWTKGGPSRLLFQHDSELHRVAPSEDGRRVAAIGPDGSVVMYDVETGVKVVSPQPHSAYATQVEWRDGRLRTSSFDGSLRTWDANLIPTLEISGDRQIREFAELDQGWAATVNRRVLGVTRHDREPLELDLGDVIEDLSASPDRSFVAIASGAELVLLDGAESRIASLRQDTAPVTPCAQFVDSSTVFFCGPYLSVFAVTLDAFTFLPFDR